jgi:hypothetical protein
MGSGAREEPVLQLEALEFDMATSEWPFIFNI